MRWLMTLLLPLVAVCGVRADTFLYVSQRPEKKIQIFRLEAGDGKLTSIETVDVDGEPAASAVDPLKKRLIVSLYNPPALASFAIDQASGKIKTLGKVLLGKGNDAAFVCTDRSGHWVLSAAYGSGKVFVHRLKEDGTIDEKLVDSATTAQTAHAVAMSPDNAWAFVPHVSLNAIVPFRFDAATGKLKQLDATPAPTEKAGPRHLAFHPTLPIGFTSDESGSSITSWRLIVDGLAPGETLSTLPADFKKNNSTAEVKVHPSGKFVWVSNRGHDSLAGFAIDAKGKLTSLGQTSTEKTPRSFDIDPDGRYIFGAGEGSGKLAVFRVNVDTGELTRIHTYDVGKSLPWVLAVKMPSK
jgi:6-phosphogluconolactonase